MNDPSVAGMSQLLQGGTTEWVQALPRYQQEHIFELLRHLSPPEAAVAWLTSSGPQDTAPFGGVKVAANLFYDNILNELQEVFCGGEKYTELRNEILKAGDAAKLIVVGTIAVWIAPVVGIAAPVVAPVIALTLAVIGNATKATACDVLGEMIASRASDSEE